MSHSPTVVVRISSYLVSTDHENSEGNPTKEEKAEREFVKMEPRQYIMSRIHGPIRTLYDALLFYPVLCHFSDMGWLGLELFIPNCVSARQKGIVVFLL